MKWKLLLTLFIGTISADQSFAQCRQVNFVQTNYAAAQATYYQTPALVAVIPAIFVPSASYTVGVSAAAYAPATSTATVTTTKTDSIVATDVGLAMLAELKAMRAESRVANLEIKSMLGGKQPPPAPAKMPAGPETLPTPKEKAAADAAIFVMKKGLAGTNVSCATCHNPTGKNGGLVAFTADGEYAGMTDDQASAMAKKVSAEKVCPKAPGALTGADKATVLEALPPLPKEERPLQGLIRPRTVDVARQ